MKSFSFFIVLTFPILIYCQDQLKGKVTTGTGEALRGAGVFISNTTIVTTTNVNGDFVLNHLPAGDISLVVSYVGYETTTTLVVPSLRTKRYLIQLQSQSNELKAVVIGKYDKRGWKKWGETFTDAFIGTSALAKNCVITNQDVIRFLYNEHTKQLHAYADVPLQIENHSLGYHISVNLMDFTYDVTDHVVDYRVYSLFTEMEGTEDKQEEWKRNRKKAYALSLLRFMRTLYNRNFRNEGYQVRTIESTSNVEKGRVQELYKSKFDLLKDSLKDVDIVNKQIEKLFSKDSLTYYKKVLAEEDRTANMHFDLQNFKDMASATDSNTVLLHFKDYLQITFSKAKEPEEYLTYKNKLYIEKGLLTKADVKEMNRGYPSTLLSLTQGIPIQIAENGHFTNTDLFMDGFWGWWEKIATALPYEYEP